MIHRRLTPVRVRMQQLRCEIDGDMEDMAASARTMVDWKHYVKTYPWVCLGAAAALGFLIVPKAIHGDTPRLGHPDRSWRGPAIWSSNRRRPPREDWSMRLLATVAGIAVRKATAYLGPKCGKITGNTLVSARRAVMIRHRTP